MPGRQKPNLSGLIELIANPLSTYTVLYIEDHPANLALVECLIARHSKFKLLTAPDGDKGIALAKSAQPDVILMDINLPGISGFDALKILSRDNATAHIPIIALSSNAFPGDIAQGIEAGFFRYLTKPYKIDDLLDVLAAATYFSEDISKEI
jgi:CheY-like chemotaxis protein